MKSWHISISVNVGIILGVFILSGLGATGIGAILIMCLFITLVWLGWTLHERALYRNELLEQRAMTRLREQGEIRINRRAKENV